MEVALRYEANDDAQILDVYLTGGSSQVAMDFSLALLAGRPDYWSWDWIVTVDGVLDGTSVETIGRLAEGYSALPQSDAITVMVSPDRQIMFWADVLEFQYPSRERHVMPDRASALALIQERRAIAKMNGK